MPLRPGITLEKLNHRGDGRLPGLMGFRVVALADTACGYGCIAHLPDGVANFTTVELKCNFLSTARDGTISCAARPVHLGGTTQVWDATVTRKADSRTIALFRCTQMLLAPRS